MMDLVRIAVSTGLRTPYHIRRHRQQRRIDLQPAALGGHQRYLEAHVATDLNEIDDAAAVEPIGVLIRDQQDRPRLRRLAQRAGAADDLLTYIKNVRAIELGHARHAAQLGPPPMNGESREQFRQLVGHVTGTGHGDDEWRVARRIFRPFDIRGEAEHERRLDGIRRVHLRRGRKAAGREEQGQQ